MRFLSLLIFCLATQVQAQFNWFDEAFLGQGNNNNVLGQGPASATGSQDFMQATTASNVATFFIASQSGTCNYCDVSIKKTGTPTSVLSCQVFTYDSINKRPNVGVGTPSATVSAASVSTSFSLIRFTGMSGSLTAGTAYCLVILGTTTQDSSNDYQWQEGAFSDPGHDTEWVYEKSSPDFWSGYGTSPLGQFLFTLYK